MVMRPHFPASLPLVGLAAVLAALLPPARPAQAAIFLVTTLEDGPKLGGSGANCQSTLMPGNPCTLRAAVQTHNGIGGTNTINLGVAGDYQLTVPGPLNND